MSTMLPVHVEACQIDSSMMMAKQGDLSVLMNAVVIPKERPGKFEGEDACFICPEKKTFGVADGVGGWSKQGIDAGDYSKQLMKQAKAAVDNEPSGSDGVDLRKVLKQAYSNTKEKGSSTACLITIKNRTLHGLNVGDTGFRVLRNGVCIYQSPIQQKKFNFPYQLSIESDKPGCAQALEVPVEVGDIIIAGTDGLFDNMWDHNIEEVVKKGTRNGISAFDLAWEIARQAGLNSSDRQYCSPYEFAAAAAAQTPRRTHIGGKMDDITVIVAYIL